MKSDSFESLRWNASVHRPGFILSSVRVLGGMESEPMLTPRDKIPFSGGSEEGQTANAASRRTASPKHYPLSYSRPQTVQNNVRVEKPELCFFITTLLLHYVGHYCSIMLGTQAGG